MSKQANEAGGYYYQVYGLTVHSDLELPELVPVDACVAQARIRFGSLPKKLDTAIHDFGWISATDEICLIKQQGIARYLISKGTEIVIDRREQRGRQRGSGARAADVRLFLLGSALGALLHQRGLLPLHVSAVQTPEGVWAFSGESGDGKSTIAAMLHKKFGCPLISDDVSVLGFEGSRPVLRPGPRKVKLWEDAVHYLGYQKESLSQDLSNTPKFQLYLATEQPSDSLPLLGLVFLDRREGSGKTALKRLSGLNAFHVCMASVYRPHMVGWFGHRAKILAELAALSNHVSVYRYSRLWSLTSLENELEVLKEEMFQRERQPA